ncbi:hypothetical protein FB45DRAFT_284615 [Roridomyces roridus]|uniref:Uncharacterized protein n=1 Tax=Roridomyces roridus TaxID=1738132 RepID=A0AAD7CAT5_9AGAR|nr:hypothetical protein FB45DRAFT_284615 [Roridomyces roridus]
MFRQCSRQILRQQVRFKATTPPRPPRADIWSIPGTIRELLPPPAPKDDPTNPNSAPRKRKGLFFYFAIASPLFMWLYLEQHLDARPLVEKKRRRVVCERLGRLRERTAGSSAPTDASVLAFVRLLFDTMLPEELLRSTRSAEVLHILERDGVPDELLAWLREVCSTVYRLSALEASDEDTEVKMGESIQDTADSILRKCYIATSQRLQSGFQPCILQQTSSYGMQHRSCTRFDAIQSHHLSNGY